MIARFTSDGSVNRGGFRAEFTATYDPSPTRFPTTSQPGKTRIKANQRNSRLEIPFSDAFDPLS